mmetsp:Transcript_16499/g.57580  ORF Transcript_16499/g.57580 Transcript_16499/m.57580 type:complete len:220 (-) Transcript_16499:1436-2095(-)
MISAPESATSAWPRAASARFALSRKVVTVDPYQSTTATTTVCSLTTFDSSVRECTVDMRTGSDAPAGPYAAPLSRSAIESRPATGAARAKNVAAWPASAAAAASCKKKETPPPPRAKFTTAASVASNEPKAPLPSMSTAPRPAVLFRKTLAPRLMKPLTGGSAFVSSAARRRPALVAQPPPPAAPPASATTRTATTPPSPLAVLPSNVELKGSNVDAAS